MRRRVLVLVGMAVVCMAAMTLVDHYIVRSLFFGMACWLLGAAATA
jgi:hypothetical protein